MTKQIQTVDKRYDVEKQSDILMAYIKTLNAPSEGKLRALIVNYAEAKSAQAQQEERERIKSAFIEHFAGAGELFFPYRGVGDVTLDDEKTVAQEEWNEVIESLKETEQQ